MMAYHFLRADMRSGQGDEPPWTVGEERTLEGPLRLCERGYHYSPSWLDALEYAPGVGSLVACVVDVDDDGPRDATKGVSHRRRLVSAVPADRALHEFGCWCADQALAVERAAGRTPDPRSVAAVETKRRWLRGEASSDELAAAATDAWAAWAAARAAARAAAWATAWAAADTAWAAGDAASTTRAAQREHLALLLGQQP